MKPKQAITHKIIAIFLFVGAALLLYLTADPIGVTWDEPAYIPAAQSYAGWFEVFFTDPIQSFDRATIDSYWSITHEHPPLAMAWNGLVWKIATAVFHASNQLTAIRLGPILMVSALVAMLYLLIAKHYGIPAGLFAAAGLLSMPRFFLHAHLASLDVPVSVMWFLFIFVFWKTVDRNDWDWGLLWGVMWGLAMATKLNAVFIPIAPLLWILLFRRKPLQLVRLLLMGMVGAGTFFMVWPWLYHDTRARFLEYIFFHVNHIPIGQWFDGVFYLPPPWFYVYLILWAVVPLTLLVMFLLGVFRSVRSKNGDNGLGCLLLINALVAILPFTFGKQMLYDNDRLFMPVYPFIASLAAIGFGLLLTWIRKLLAGWKRPALAAPVSLLLGAALLLPQSLSAVSLYPHLLSYYSESVGGLPGATRLGFETTYWCETYVSALPYINEHASPGDTIWTQDWSFEVLKYYQKIGRLRPDVVVLKVGWGNLNFFNIDWYIFEYRQTQYGKAGAEYYQPLQILQDQIPIYEVIHQGIPLMRLYGRIK
ncbi:MAG: glycosyltransferase family 39 protein [Anaerolineaceae bacterium]|nr:glycosyltransferase family 39 protein [Anaerolineaceae bacterium]